MFRTIVLMRKKGKLTKELNDRDLKNFNDITEYIGMSSLSPIEQEEIYQQVLDMMLQAKNEGKFASEVISDDMKGFCDSIIEESNYNKNVLHKCFNYIESFFQVGLIYFLTIFIFNIILSGGHSSFNNQDVFSIDTVMYAVLFIVIFPLVQRKTIFTKNKNKKNSPWVFGTLFICSFFIVSITDMIKIKFPQLTTAHINSHSNELFFLIIFLIAFGRDICYLITSISRKFREK